MHDETFEPLLGRMRTSASNGRQSYHRAILVATRRAGGLQRASRRRFTGWRTGRGAAAATILASRGRRSGVGARRAIVKTRLVRLGGNRSSAAARAHLRYIERDGVERDGGPGRLYSAREDCSDGKAFITRCNGDRHQFRLIVSAEDGAEYDDLKPLARRFMARLEQDLGTRLDWVAVDHRDTAHPHTHIIVRGKDETGANLVIARDYIARGMRERLAELVTLDLGPRTRLDIERASGREVGADRLTPLDRQLIREAGPGAVVASAHRDPLRQALRTARLRKLETLGLAESLGGGRWALDRALEQRLRAIGERGDIIRTMQRALSAAGIERTVGDRVLSTGDPPDRPVVGRLIARGLSDELADRHYLIVDATDGRVHHIDAGSGASLEPLPAGAIVRISPAPAGPRAADRTVADVAARNGGRYSLERHLEHDPLASAEFARGHLRRLEALRRGGAGVERHSDGSWAILSDHVERAAAFEQRNAQRQPVRVALLSPMPLDELASAEGATWLDRQLVAPDPEPLRDSGFGKDVRSALALRRQWLLAEGLGVEQSDGVAFRPDLLETLQRRELRRVASSISNALGLAYREAEPGMRMTGQARTRLDLASGRFAVIANSREFSLVPWRPALEREFGRELDLVMKQSGVSWAIARSAELPRTALQIILRPGHAQDSRACGVLRRGGATDGQRKG